LKKILILKKLINLNFMKFKEIFNIIESIS
jgi:hypothetical protein